jgi:hypothetical protein
MTLYIAASCCTAYIWLLARFIISRVSTAFHVVHSPCLYCKNTPNVSASMAILKCTFESSQSDQNMQCVRLQYRQEDWTTAKAARIRESTLKSGCCFIFVSEIFQSGWNFVVISRASFRCFINSFLIWRKLKTFFK